MAKKKREVGFSFELSNSKILKSVAEVLNNVCGDMIFISDSDSITLQGMDDGRIGFVIFNIPKSKLEEFYSDGEHFVGVSSEDLNKIFQRIKPEENITISFSEPDQKIKITAQVIDTKKKRTFRLAVLDISVGSEVGDIPDLRKASIFDVDYDVFFIPRISDFIEAVKDAEIYSDIINMNALEKEELVRFESNGVSGDWEYELSIEELQDYNIPKDVRSSYSIQMIKRILKLEPISKSLEISLTADLPLKLDFEIIDNYRIFYFLGARVDDDNDDDSILEEDF